MTQLLELSQTIGYENGEAESIYQKMRAHFGFLIMKPDALELGIAEELLGIACSVFLEDIGVSVHNGELIEIASTDDMKLLYPHIREYDVWNHLENYLLGKEIVVNTFYSEQPRDMETLMKEVKGVKMRDWNVEQLEGSVGITTFLRGIIPVPGTISRMAPIVEWILTTKKSGLELKFTDDDFGEYIKTLVHSPEGCDEYLGIVSLLSQQHRNLIFNYL